MISTKLRLVALPLVALPLAALPLAALPLAGVGGATATTADDDPGCPAHWTITACDYLGNPSATTASHVTPPRPQVLRFLDVQDRFATLDVGAAGDSPGDTLFFDNQLRDPTDTRRVGRFVSRCIQGVGDWYHCQGTLQLEDSKIELATTTTLAEPNGIVAAVTGGTGRYAGAAGQVHIRPTGTPGASRLVVKLTRG